MSLYNTIHLKHAEFILTTNIALQRDCTVFSGVAHFVAKICVVYALCIFAFIPETTLFPLLT